MILKIIKKGNVCMLYIFVVGFFWEYMYGIEENIIIRIFFDGI